MNKQIKKAIVLGSGALKIGQAGEFDYSGSQALKALKEEGISTVLINPNIATIQTSEGIADKVYFLPVTPYFVEEIIKKEKPDGILLAFGGQTALNCGTEMYLNGTLAKYGVEVLGTSVEAIMTTEDRDLFVKSLNQIDAKTPVSQAVESMEDAIAAAERIGFPVMVRSAYALGGLGSGICNNHAEFKTLCENAFAYSKQILVEESLKGWKEIEFEVIRDKNDHCFTVVPMENVDPLGVHTGESIVVAPICSLSKEQISLLEDIARKVVRHIGIVGECNIQYAFNATTNDYRIIEINARLSRSSALASKASGYPLAFVAAKLALGYSLDQIGEMGTPNSAYVAPSVDYMIVKIPRWDLSKFVGVSRQIGSSMKSVGEIMSIGKSFEEIIQKGLRMIGQGMHGFVGNNDLEFDNLDEELANPTDLRIFAIAKAFEQGYTVEKVHDLTKIDHWFLGGLKNIVDYSNVLKTYNKIEDLPVDVLKEAKRLGFSDFQIARFVEEGKGNLENDSLRVRALRKENNILPSVKRINTIASENPDKTNYLYLTYEAPLNPPSGGDFVTAQSSKLYNTANPLNYELLKENAKNRRKNPTEAESFLWKNLQCKEFENYKFRREHVIGDFIVDLVCLSKQLVIEVDGGYHNDENQQELDNVRTEYLNQHGFTVIRFTNEEVLFDIDKTLKTIEVALTQVPLEGGFRGAEAIVVLGSGAYRIGSSVEFDWCSVNAVQTARKLGYKSIMINYNPETVSTDYDMCDRLYFDELSFERVLDVMDLEMPKGVIISMGGQIPNNLAVRLHRQDIPILGTSPLSIDRAENRHKFSSMLDQLGIDQPAWQELTSLEEIQGFVAKVGYPVLVRPSYVLSGAAMNVCYNEEELETFLKLAKNVSKEYPVVVSQFLQNAKEIEFDAVAHNGEIVEYAISEHVEFAGVHSGDATLVFPAQKIYFETARRIKRISKKIAKELNISGPFNMQFLAKNNDVKVIECNLRASRSFPFVSKVLKRNFIETATKIMLGAPYEKPDTSVFDIDWIGVKASQFSFARLQNADPVLSVDMSSTGEVGCLGDDFSEALLSSMISVGYNIPKKTIMVSSGDSKSKVDLLDACKMLQEYNYDIYATGGTRDFLEANGVKATVVSWPDENKDNNIMDMMANHKFDLVVNIPKNHTRRELTNGYKIRRGAIDYNIPLLTNARLASAFIEAFCNMKESDIAIKSWQEYEL